MLPHVPYLVNVHAMLTIGVVHNTGNVDVDLDVSVVLISGQQTRGRELEIGQLRSSKSQRHKTIGRNDVQQH